MYMTLHAPLTINVHTIYHSMVQLLKAGTKPYVDLTVSFSNDSGEDVPGPPIRYFFVS